MPRFVILFHYWPDSGRFQSDHHWDLMFEAGDQLETWATESDPLDSLELSAVKLPPHRLAYLDFEGPVSKHRGTVKQVLTGNYDWAVPSNQPAVVGFHPDDSSQERFERSYFGLRLSFQQETVLAVFTQISLDRWTVNLSGQLGS